MKQIFFSDLVSTNSEEANIANTGMHYPGNKKEMKEIKMAVKCPINWSGFLLCLILFKTKQ